MLNVILTGHGRFGSGLAAASTQIIGEQPNFHYVDFTVEMSTEQLVDKIKTIIEVEGKESNFVFLTDLLGGTPFRVASMMTQELKSCEVITGTNLQMLVQMLLERDECASTEDFRKEAISCGRDGITSLFDELSKEKVPEVETDGI